MPYIIVKEPFKFSEDGLTVREFSPGDEPVEVNDLCEKYALKHKVGEEAEDNAEPEKVDELKAWLTERGVEIPQGAKKPELQALYESNKEKKDDA